MKNKRDSGTAMFLMEMIAVVCFFILCAGVCILAFVKADQISCLAKDTNYASLAAESVAEIWKAQDVEGLEMRFLMSKDGEKGVIYWNCQWTPVENEKTADYKAEIGLTGDGLVREAQIRIRRLKDDTELFELDASKPSCARRAGCTATHESQAGAFGIPEFMPPIRRRDFYGNLPLENRIWKGTGI